MNKNNIVYLGELGSNTGYVSKIKSGYNKVSILTHSDTVLVDFDKELSGIPNTITEGTTRLIEKSVTTTFEVNDGSNLCLYNFGDATVVNIILEPKSTNEQNNDLGKF